MTLSTSVETQISKNIASLGNTIWIVKETQNYNTYNETHPGSWSEASSGSTTAFIKPFNLTTASGEEYHYLTQGIIKEDDYLGWINGAETLEESTDGTTATRYKIEHNTTDYEIIKIFPPEFQDNVVFKKCVLRRITT